MTSTIDISLLSPTFYEENPNPNDASSMVRGLYYSPILFYEPDLYILQQVQVNPKRGVFDFQFDRYTGEVTAKFPIHELNLRSDEDLFVVRGKRRPVVIISVSVIPTDVIAKKNLPYDRICLAAPVFSFKREHTAVTKLEYAGFRHENRFYLPHNADGLFIREESYVDFDRVQPVLFHHLRAFKCLSNNVPIRLSECAYTLLTEWFISFTNPPKADIEILKDIEAYGDLLLEAAGNSA